jgi:hypothetical protein
MADRMLSCGTRRNVFSILIRSDFLLQHMDGVTSFHTWQSNEFKCDEFPIQSADHSSHVIQD